MTCNSSAFALECSSPIGTFLWWVSIAYSNFVLVSYLSGNWWLKVGIVIQKKKKKTHEKVEGGGDDHNKVKNVSVLVFLNTEDSKGRHLIYFLHHLFQFNQLVIKCQFCWTSAITQVTFVMLQPEVGRFLWDFFLPKASQLNYQVFYCRLQ